MRPIARQGQIDVQQVLIFNPSPRLVRLFPVSDGWSAGTALWGLLALAASAVVVAASRDPYRR